MTDPAPSHDAEAKAPDADKAALKAQGAQVRKRLDANPRVEKLPAEGIEIYGANQFLSAQVCDRFVAMVDGVARPSTTFELEYGARHRTSYSGDVDPGHTLVRSINRRIDDLLGIDSSFGEGVQGQRYLPGQEFKDHYDWFWTGSDYWKAQVAEGGQRSWTVMAYLNEVEEGGSTDFPNVGLSVPPQKGLLLIWNNASPDGTVNVDTLHSGTAVKRGVKYIFTKWYRTRRWG